MYIQNQKSGARPTPVVSTEPKSPLKHTEYLRNNIGRKIKVEYITNNAINELYGQLIKVGEDFITIKLPSSPLSTAVFKTDKINKIIIIFEEK